MVLVTLTMAGCDCQSNFVLHIHFQCLFPPQHFFKRHFAFFFRCVFSASLTLSLFDTAIVNWQISEFCVIWTLLEQRCNEYFVWEIAFGGHSSSLFLWVSEAAEHPNLVHFRLEQSCWLLTLLLAEPKQRLKQSSDKCHSSSSRSHKLRNSSVCGQCTLGLSPETRVWCSKVSLT